MFGMALGLACAHDVLLTQIPPCRISRRAVSNQAQEPNACGNAPAEGRQVQILIRGMQTSVRKGKAHQHRRQVEELLEAVDNGNCPARAQENGGDTKSLSVSLSCGTNS